MPTNVEGAAPKITPNFDPRKVEKVTTLISSLAPLSAEEKLAIIQAVTAGGGGGQGLPVNNRITMAAPSAATGKGKGEVHAAAPTPKTALCESPSDSDCDNSTSHLSDSESDVDSDEALHEGAYHRNLQGLHSDEDSD